MSRRIRITVLGAFALTLMLLPGVGQAMLVLAPEHADEVASERLVHLNPQKLVVLAARGEAIELPTLEGDVSATLVSASHPVRILHEGPAGLVDAGSYQTNIWTFTSGDAHGVILLREDLLRARINTPEGVSMIEPAASTPVNGEGLYRVYRPMEKLPPPGAPITFDSIVAGEPQTVEREEQEFSIMTHTVTRTTVIYVDSTYRSQYGTLTWPDQVAYIHALINARMADAKLNYVFETGVYSTYFDTDSETTSWNTITGRPFLGAQVRGAWVFRDWGGCTIGRAEQPGNTMHIQHTPDACHSWLTPVNDFDRYYLTTHEFAHNQNADHGASERWFTTHTHRDITDPSAWYHYHDYISAANLNRMRAHLGTND